MPFPAGGATDAIARIIQESLSETLGQQIVIEDVGGAGGMIGAARVARAAPDGYTLLLHQVALAAGMSLYPKLAFEAEKDFAPIGIVNVSSSTIAARGSLAGQYHGGADRLDEGAGPERQDGARRRGLVRPSVRRAVRPGGRSEGHPECRIAAADRRSTIWSPGMPT